MNFMNDVSQSSFKTYLPIQLDASCNGYQHISLLTRATEIFEQLNTLPTTKNDKPNYFYLYLLVNVFDRLRTLIDTNTFLNNEDRESGYRLFRLGLTRAMVKKAMMTFSYSTTAKSMVLYLKEGLYSFTVPVPNTENDYETITLYCFYENTKDKYVTDSDLYYFIRLFKKVMDLVFPKMKKLKNYLNDIVTICSKLSIPIP